MNPKKHWEDVYQTKKEDQVSWFQPHLLKSLELIRETGVAHKGNIIDVGGGASMLADDLLLEGHSNLIVLDISSEALRKSKERLGEKGDKIAWIEADILKVDFPENSFDLWHDRAVFHFLTEPTERKKKYTETLKSSLKSEGFLVMATFSLEGPLKCSGLQVVRYSPETLSQELGNDFFLLKSVNERHQAPSGTIQDFIYCVFKKL